MRSWGRLGYGLHNQDSIPGGVSGGDFFFPTASKLVLGPTQPPIQWAPEVKRPGCEAEYSPLSTAQVNT